MSAEAEDLWRRARRALLTARQLVEEDPDASASRAYYAAYFAASALFALRERFFAKHSALEAAVHRDLARPGEWPTDLGADFSWLASLRYTGDYGGEQHVSSAEAAQAVAKAARIRETVRRAAPDRFPEDG